MEAKVHADKESLIKDIAYMLQFLGISQLIMVLHFVRKIW